VGRLTVPNVGGGCASHSSTSFSTWWLWGRMHLNAFCYLYGTATAHIERKGDIMQVLTALGTLLSVTHLRD